jgi:hypothetical protein
MWGLLIIANFSLKGILDLYSLPLPSLFFSTSQSWGENLLCRMCCLTTDPKSTGTIDQALKSPKLWSQINLSSLQENLSKFSTTNGADSSKESAACAHPQKMPCGLGPVAQCGASLATVSVDFFPFQSSILWSSLCFLELHLCNLSASKCTCGLCFQNNSNSDTIPMPLRLGLSVHKWPVGWVTSANPTPPDALEEKVGEWLFEYKADPVIWAYWWSCIHF